MTKTPSRSGQKTCSQDTLRIGRLITDGDPTVSFLNACQSGRFRALTRSEMGGFAAAFLVLGRRALIAPVTHVDPLAAVSLAKVFLNQLRDGKSVARALQMARLSLKNSGLPPSSWAAHHMSGLDLTIF